MSGDVQPRKRNKDKKRRRDEEETRPTGVHATKMGPEDILLHVHSDHGTGGHWCAKVFFFSLLAILLGLIGLIILENRGLADLDTPLSESRFADVLEGWVDEKREVHDEHDVHPPDSHEQDEHDEHDEPGDQDDHDEHDDDGEHDDGHDEHEQDNDNLANSQENDDEENDDDGDDDAENELADKDDADDDNEKDEGFDESGETEDAATDADEDDDQTISKSAKLTTDAVIDDANNNVQATNKNTQNIDINKRSPVVSTQPNQDKQDTADDVGTVTVSQLKQQVDDLVDNYNKLAKTLNRPPLHEIKKDDNDDDQDDDEDDENRLDTENDNDQNEEKDDNDNDDDDDDEDEGVADEDTDDADNDDDAQDADDVAKADKAPDVDDDGNEIEQSDVQDDDAQDDDEDEESASHLDEEDKVPSDGETMPDVSAEFLEMKRRFTLVTEEEPIPLSDEDQMEHPILIETIPPPDECDKSIEAENSKTIAPDAPTQIKQITSTISSSIKQLSNDEQIGVAKTGDNQENDVHLDEELYSDEEEEEEEEEISSERNDYDSESSVDDSDLLKRLDEKYGKLPPASDEDDANYDVDDEDIDPTWTKIDRSGPAAFQTEDQLLDDEIRRANEQLAEDPKSALTHFEHLREKYPQSTAVQYGLAKALDILAELNRSNVLLRRAISEYIKYLELGSKLNDTEFKLAAERCIERMRFIGEHIKAVPIHEQLIQRFDDNPHYRNQLAVTYLLVNRMADAKYVLHTTLQRWRDDGFAAVHYGFVLKNLDNNLEHAVIFLRQGIESGANGTNDGRFYFNLGDALIRLGRHNEAKDVFKKAAKKKLFLSEYQRSLYNVDHLKAQPFWTLAETGYKHEFRTLEQNWMRIRDEGLNLLNSDGYFTDEAENLRDKGVWKQFELFARAKRNAENCKRTPFTCKLIETFPAARFCKRGQVKFSVMHPDTHVWPHCGPTNCRLRAHLGLKTADKTLIRVATETRTWSEGKIMIFDDSFEHEVWHNGTTFRLILIVDVWHPDLSAEEKKTLVPI